jgi:hypothetical protein
MWDPLDRTTNEFYDHIFFRDLVCFFMFVFVLLRLIEVEVLCRRDCLLVMIGVRTRRVSVG